MSKHAAVWIDHQEACIFFIYADRIEEVAITAPSPDQHPKKSENAKDHLTEEERFFQLVARAIDSTEGILIVGPSTAKLEFLRYVHRNEHAIERRIVGIETVEHPTDRQIISYTKQYFLQSTRMR